MIEIYVVTFADLPLAKPQSVIFPGNGGSIGRSPENTMILLDPERLVSRIQAHIYKSDESYESYVIENLSSASVIFVGNTELGKHEQTLLDEGMEIKIGLYVLGTRYIENSKQELSLVPTQMEVSTPQIKGDPIDDPLSLFGSTSSISTNNPLADLMDTSNTNIPVPKSSNFSGFESDVPVLSKEVAYKKMPVTIPEDFNAFSLPSAVKRNTDNPLAELRTNNTISLKGMYEINESTDKLVDHGILRYDLNANDLHEDKSAHMLSNMLNVDPMAMFDNEPSLLPDNKLEPQYSLPNHGSELKAPFTKLQNRAVSNDKRTSQNIEDILSDVHIVDAKNIPETKANFSSDSIAQNKSDERESIPSVAVEKKNPELGSIRSKIVESTFALKNKTTAAPLAAAKNIKQEDIPTEVKIVKHSDSDIHLKEDLLTAFLSGAGVSGTPLVNHLDAAFMTKLGEMLQICVSGAVDLIQARAATKREFRSEVTMIVTKGNNPLKFSPDGQAAMLQLLGKPFPGFIPAVPALQDTFDDLRAHEVGMIVGTRAALHEVLNRFSPDELEKRLTTPTLLQTVIPSQRKAHLWKMYNELFQKIFDEAEDDFETLYGKAFRDAYEDEVERLKSKIKE
jgi:FHA domain-containing protein